MSTRCMLIPAEYLVFKLLLFQCKTLKKKTKSNRSCEELTGHDEWFRVPSKVVGRWFCIRDVVVNEFHCTRQRCSVQFSSHVDGVDLNESHEHGRNIGYAKGTINEFGVDGLLRLLSG